MGDEVLKSTMSYGDYLGLDEVLSAQHPLTDAHDELLFLIQHQATELWLKLLLHELAAATELIEHGTYRPAFKMLARVSRVMRVQIEAWDVLSTMTPSEYTTFRSALGTSSGYQSYQYRELEFRLGNRDRAYLDPFRDRPEIHARLAAVLAAPSTYDAVIRQLAGRGFPVDPALLERDWATPHRHDDSVLAAWQAVYRDPETHWDLYELAEKLVDIEDMFRQWRMRHVTTVERVIGAKTGTGGTSGVPYLRDRLAVVLFPELWHVRTEL